MLLVVIDSFLINTQHHHLKLLRKAPHKGMALLKFLGSQGELRGQRSGCSPSRDHRDATGPIWLFSWCLSCEPPKLGLICPYMGSPRQWRASDFLRSFVSILRRGETSKPLNITHKTRPEALLWAHLSLCLLCRHHLPWHRGGTCRACPRGLKSRSRMPAKWVLGIWKYDMLIQMFLSAFQTFPTFLASGFYLRRRNLET